ncbi:envelope stress sensor histidine kinase CpxA [Aggregatibacter actinomycetemcomitans]|uniref:envelope stress sensor histidine kinase CpxA n=1 Tax=Aggregatibacter actinomycetemcomitans TaxID=714 RepID=UPI0019D1FA3A|nr:envelope stress sensor histidine kinase CpxA [Aggregatibacter actinomycetemcomitans]MBN6063850.1 envelope stress sensor histidine kinase CpxA [Aggregatibacter actinomycetemcomitans]
MFRKEFIFNSLTIRIFTFFWLTFSILLIFIFLLPYFDAHIYSDLKEHEMVKYQKEITTSMRNNQISRILAGIPSFPNDRFTPHPVLISPSGQILGALPEEEKSVRQFIFNNASLDQPLKKIYSNIQIVGPFSLYLNPEHNQSYSLYFVNQINAQKEILNYIFDRPFFLIILVILISTPLLWWLSRSIGQPIRNLQLAANAVAIGNLKINKNLETKGLIELRQVGQSFNRMMLSLEEVLSNQQSLLSSISHELRTPLTRLQLATALLRRRLGDSNEIQRIDTEAQRLDKMVSDLLQLSRQQLNSHLEKDIFPIPLLWKEILEDAKFEAAQRNIRFNVEQGIPHPEQYYLNGNHGLLASAVENIVRNALKYTKSAISVHIYRHENDLFIRIEDNGAGLPEDEYEKIFKPFYRVDETRTRETGGTGLGLSIVANTAKDHHGAVWAGKADLGGLAVILRLPLWVAK